MQFGASPPHVQNCYAIITHELKRKIKIIKHSSHCLFFKLKLLLKIYADTVHFQRLWQNFITSKNDFKRNYEAKRKSKQIFKETFKISTLKKKFKCSNFNKKAPRHIRNQKYLLITQVLKNMPRIKYPAESRIEPATMDMTARPRF